MKRVTLKSALAQIAIICFIILVVGDDDCDVCYTYPAMMLRLAGCGLVIFFGSIIFTKRFSKTENEIFFIESLPLLDTDEATAGIPFSCQGIITSANGEQLKAPYSGFDCLYYHSVTEKYVRQGKSGKWVITEEHRNYVPCKITDDRGSLEIHLASIDQDLSGYELHKNDKKIFLKNMELRKSEIATTSVMKHSKFVPDEFTGKFIKPSMRRSEFIVIPNSEVFAYGFVVRDNGKLILLEHKDHPLIISNKTKKEYIDEFYKGSDLIYAVHFLTAFGFSLALWSANHFIQLDKVLLSGLLIAGNVIFIGSLGFTFFNRMAVFKQRALSALSNIDVELKRRADLIPELVKLVKQFDKHEKELQEYVAEMRVSTVFQKDLPEKERAIKSPIIAIAESYPNLVSMKLYQDLMKSLVDTEERITQSRTFYNLNVSRLNQMVVMFPYNVIAKMGNLKTMEYVILENA